MSKLFETTFIKSGNIFSNLLSDRERTCLLMAANGLTAEQSADLMHISATTVASHRASILRKLNVKNMTHAVYVGIQYGLILIPHSTVFNLERLKSGLL